MTVALTQAFDESESEALLARAPQQPLSRAEGIERGPGMSKEYRRETRHMVTVAGRYRPRQGGARDVWIKDISEYGCKFFDKFSVLHTNTSILVKVGNVGPIPADVKWREGHTVGAQFEHPLHPSVLDHIIREMDEGEQQ